MSSKDDEKGAYVTVHATVPMLCLALILVSVRSIAVSKPTRPAVAKSFVHEGSLPATTRMIRGDGVRSHCK